jgi:Tol biopolymer transport system component
MRSRPPVFRVFAAITRPRRPAPFVVAVAIGLLVSAASPLATVTATAATKPGAGHLERPPVDVPIRPAPPAEPVSLAPPPGTTTLVSVDRNAGFAGGVSAQASISANGRYVAFASLASDLVENDTNEAVDVFVRDRRQPASTIRLPLPNGRQVPTGGSATDPSISADGSVVAFVFRPPQSPTGAVVIPALPIVLAWVRATNETEIVSFDTGGKIARDSTEPSVSGDGSRIAFRSTYPLVDNEGSPGNIFVRDRVADSTTLVSVNLNGGQSTWFCRAPAISRDGRIVAFESQAPDLVAGDNNESIDVFARDLDAKTTELISVGVGAGGNGQSQAPAVSGDGQRVAFESRATNLIAGGTPSGGNVYLRDRTVATTTIVSTGLNGAGPTGDSGQVAISDDGRIVAFASAADNLVASTANADLAGTVVPSRSEIYARDTVTGETIRISEARAGGPGGGIGMGPTIGGNGRYVAFASTSSVLVNGDTNNLGDVFIRDLPPAPILNPPSLDFGVRAISTTGPPVAAILTNTGWGPLTGRGSTRSGDAAADFAIAFDGCRAVTLHRLESCPVTVTFVPTAKGTRLAQLTVAHDGPKSPATARLRGGGSEALVKLQPPVGAPGIVVIATGSDFPPNTTITLHWSRGLTPKVRPITTDAKGNFRVQVLIFHHDLVGKRDLIVTTGGTGFPAFGAPFLVVESPSQPPRFIVQGPYSDRPPTLVMRR